MPRLVVLLPAYNAASTLQAALDSTLRALPRDAGVMVLDDGSSDGTDSSKQKKQKQKRRGKHPLFQTALFKRKEDKHDSKT